MEPQINVPTPMPLGILTDNNNQLVNAIQKLDVIIDRTERIQSELEGADNPTEPELAKADLFGTLPIMQELINTLHTKLDYLSVMVDKFERLP